MPRFSRVFQLGKTQLELDFVDVSLHTDDWLFIDPFSISQRVDPWSRDAHRTLVSFFQKIVDDIRSNNLQDAEALLTQSPRAERNSFRPFKEEIRRCGYRTVSSAPAF
jgi:hypothetical protein